MKQYLTFLFLLQFVQGESNQVTLENLSTSLLQSLTNSTLTNVVISPASLGSALGMVYLGAKGNTQSQLGQFLGLSSDTSEAKKELFQLQNSLQSSSKDKVTWLMANRILVNKFLKIIEKYQNEVQNEFKSRIDNFDFSKPEETASEVNSWISNNTNKFIKKIVQPEDLPESTLLVLLNAVYFKGDWKYPFPINKTRKGCFYSEPKVCTQVDIMSQERKLNFVKSSDLQADILELPYDGGNYYMIIVLPKKQDGLKTVLGKLKSNLLSSILKKLQKMKVSLQMPKFENEFQKELKDSLEKLGVTDMFVKADLSNMIEGGGGVQITKVIHKAKISVTETGSEAGAGTAIIGGRSASFPFTVDHPFLYFILKNNSEVLFSGVMVKPK